MYVQLYTDVRTIQEILRGSAPMIIWSSDGTIPIQELELELESESTLFKA